MNHRVVSISPSLSKLALLFQVALVVGFAGVMASAFGSFLWAALVTLVFSVPHFAPWAIVVGSSVDIRVNSEVTVRQCGRETELGQLSKLTIHEPRVFPSVLGPTLIGNNQRVRAIALIKNNFLKPDARAQFDDLLAEDRATRR